MVVEKYLRAFWVLLFTYMVKGFTGKLSAKHDMSLLYFTSITCWKCILLVQFIQSAWQITHRAPVDVQERAFSKRFRKFLQRTESLPTAVTQHHDCLVKPNWPEMYLRYFHPITQIFLLNCLNLICQQQQLTPVFTFTQLKKCNPCRFLLRQVERQ